MHLGSLYLSHLLAMFRLWFVPERLMCLSMVFKRKILKGRGLSKRWGLMGDNWFRTALMRQWPVPQSGVVFTEVEQFLREQLVMKAAAWPFLGLLLPFSPCNLLSCMCHVIPSAIGLQQKLMPGFSEFRICEPDECFGYSTRATQNTGREPPSCHGQAHYHWAEDTALIQGWV